MPCLAVQQQSQSGEMTEGISLQGSGLSEKTLESRDLSKSLLSWVILTKIIMAPRTLPVIEKVCPSSVHVALSCQSATNPMDASLDRRTCNTWDSSTRRSSFRVAPMGKPDRAEAPP